MARRKEKRNAYTFWGGKENQKERRLAKPRRRWEDNIKVGIGKDMIGGCGMTWDIASSRFS